MYVSQRVTCFGVNYPLLLHITVPTNENRDDRNNWQFRPKVKVSLDLNVLGVSSLPSSTDFLEEVHRVHE